MKLIPTYFRHDENLNWLCIYKDTVYMDDIPITKVKPKDIMVTYKNLAQHHYVRVISKQQLYLVKQRFIENRYNKDSV